MVIAKADDLQPGSLASHIQDELTKGLWCDSLLKNDFRYAMVRTKVSTSIKLKFF